MKWDLFRFLVWEIKMKFKLKTDGDSVTYRYEVVAPDGSVVKTYFGSAATVSPADLQSIASMSNFDKDLTGWCVTNITSEPSNFSLSSALTAGHKPIWGTCP